MFLVSTRTAPLLLLALACGACAGLWDLTAAALHETLAILAVSAALLAAAAPPRRAPLLALAVAAGVLLAHLVSPPPPGAQLAPLERGLISAAVAAVPALAGAAAGAGAARLLARRGRA
ncbi:hypothetical protein [Rhodocista pekingensis]|uniref:Uncharacterized protein n=1 Tax=Rhodocista pekingensis TaxID=201185 RepID=A0ABW2KU27_9PROT